MKVAYSCAGEGFGHAARMVALYEDLASLFSLELFVPDTVRGFVDAKLPGLKTRSVPCFLLDKRNNKVRYAPTAFASIRTLAALPRMVRRLSRTLRRLGVDAVLSDFEPVLPWAARLAGIPVVQMNHPAIVCRYVNLDPRSWVASAAARFLQGPWDHRILVSFYGGDVGPVLRKSLYRHRLRDEGFLAVNLKGDARGKVLPQLGTCGLPYRLHPSPGLDFDESLASCSAVLTGAGHQTISEALCLGKPVMALPQRGQYEQILNARMLEASGRGLWCYAEDLSTTLPRFLDRLGEFGAPAPELRGAYSFRDSRDRLIGRLASALRACGGEARPEVAARTVRSA